MKDSKTKNKIIGISIGILIVLLVVISSTYAYWQITKSQQDPNSIIAACLDFNVDFPVGISKDNAWPISDSEGMNLGGYTFTVTNNCDTDVNYVIGLESVTSDGITNYLLDSSVGIGFDGVNKGTYADLTDLEGPSADARESKELQTAVVKGNGENTHNLKLWIDSTSDVSEQGRGFAAKLFITGGQEIENDNPNILTADACFEMDGNEIIGYDEACGESVVIPATVNGVAVKSIDSDAFKNITYQYNYNYGIIAEGYNPVAAIIFNKEKETEIREWASSIGITEESMPFYYEDNVVVNEGQRIQYCPDASSGQMPECIDADGIDLKSLNSKTVKITGLNLSYAYNLEKIEDYAFSNLTDDTINDYNNVDYSLTSLVMGTHELKLGYLSFGRINVDELTTYVTLNMDKHSFSPFFKSNINSLEIKPVGDNGEMSYVEYHDDWKAYVSILYGYMENIQNLKLAEGITNIPGNMFLDSNIENLELPSTLKNIGPHSLKGLNINDLILPEGVNNVGDYAFYRSKFNTISFPNTLKTIGRSAFQECTNLTDITLNEGLTSIGDWAFYSNPNLIYVSAPSTITNFGYGAFNDSGTGKLLINKPNLDGVTTNEYWNGNLAIEFKQN